MLGYEPRQVTTQDCLVLCNLANMVIKEMQRDKLLLEKENSGQLLQRRNSKLNVISFAVYRTKICCSLSQASMALIKHLASLVAAAGHELLSWLEES